MDSHTQ